ncbi:hypothetical protein AB7C87_18055 [Natrarchaeobius sp. A-rgal3]|uniref:hypothetical protein n=1 Tax=Natrarchaeobius versutus TaxID=1679078 RepID=UPI0035106722
MDSETASHRSLLALAGGASLCCLAPGAVATAGGGAAVGLAAGLGQVVVTALTLAIIGLVVSWRRDCSTCDR